MAFDTKETDIIKWGVQNGKSRQEVEKAVALYRTGYVPPEPAPAPGNSTGRDLAIGAAKGLGEGFQAMADVGRGVSAFATRPIIGDAANQTPEEKALDVRGRAALESDNTTQTIGKSLELGAELLSPFVAARLARIASAVPRAVTKVSTVAQTGLGGKIKNALSKASEVIKDPKLALAKRNVSPQLESSANRLFLDGTERLKDPIGTYETYLTQSKAAIKDIKADPAIATVGESIGDAFKGVVTNRRAVGKTMSEELKKVGTIRTNVLPTVDNFVTSLSDEGLVYDRVKQAISRTAKQTKMSQSDVVILEDYAKQLQGLGSKPTIAELDAFLSRIPNEIEVYKAKNAIIGSTNAERIIKGSLSSLREQFDPVKTGNKALEGYSTARKQYSELSDFINEGQGFLGKLTQSGDFAKDASLAKSSVQSILNQGKKDWLEKLETLTGYQALDDSVLALQAMKDAGDFRALSLLEELSKGTPTSATGFTQKVIDFAMAKAGRVVGGTPEEQTRAFLNALKEGAEKQAKGAAFGIAAGVPLAAAATSGETSLSDAAFPDPNSKARIQTTVDANGVINIRNPQTGQNTQIDPMMIMSFVGASGAMTKPAATVANHVTSAKQVLAEMPNTRMAEVLTRLRTNIADGLAHEGHTQLANTVRNITTMGANSIDDFATRIAPLMKDSAVAGLAATSGFTKRQTTLALDYYKDYLVKELSKSHGKLNITTEEKAKELLDYIKTGKKFDYEDAAYAARVLRQMGSKDVKNVADFLDDMKPQSQTRKAVKKGVDYLRSKFK